MPPNPFESNLPTMPNVVDGPVTRPSYFELDSLRGLAAFVVLANHLEMAWSGPHPAGSGIGVSLVNLTLPFGPEAVILFFVLSGFVLPARGRGQASILFHVHDAPGVSDLLSLSRRARDFCCCVVVSP